MTHIAQLSITLTLFHALAAGTQSRPALSDTIVFGDAASEAAHGFSEAESATATGALGEPCRRIGPNGHLTFRLTCDPEKQNCLTVKLWGSDTGRGQLYLYDGEKRIGGYQRMWPELDLMRDEPAFPGRFIYSTYLIPEEMTRGKREVTLRIGSTGQPTPYSRSRKEADQRDLSRGIYRAYVGTDPFVVPAPDEKQGRAPEPAAPLQHPQGLSPIEHLHHQIDLAVARMLKWQYYGEEWDQWVAEGTAPAGLSGGIVIRGAKSNKWTAEEWRDGAARRMGGNRVCMLVPEVYARAYHAKWSRCHQDRRLIDRVVRALDYFRVAQGYNGGFDDIWSRKWVGGPKRRRAGNCLEGFGHMGIGAAFLLMKQEIERSRCLDELVDEDDNPNTPSVPRRDAWTRLFQGSRDFLTTTRGHAPNQDIANQVASYLSNLCLRELSPEQAWPEDKIRKYAYAACGFEPSIYGGTWISRKGISCEPHGTLNGGYCGNYGEVTEPLCYLAQLTGDKRIEQRALQVAHTHALFRYPSLDAEHRPVLRKEGVITWRNNFTPGKISYGGNAHAAAVLGDRLSLRELQLALQHGHFYRIDLDRYWAHLQGTTVTLMRAVDHLEQAMELPASAARLPFEAGRPDFAWADEEAAAVVVRHHGERLMMSLNWRHGFQGRKRALGNVQVNNIARTHYTTPSIDRIANVRMESRDGFAGFYVCRYGKYLVGMNASGSKTYELPIPPDWPRARDLVSGRIFQQGGTAVVPARTTVVLCTSSSIP